MKLLLAHGADPNATAGGKTPFAWGEEQGHA